MASKSVKQANSDHEGRIADAVTASRASVATATAAYNGLASGYVAFAASVASAEATRDTAIAASIITKQQDLDALRHEQQRQQPAQIRVTNGVAGTSPLLGPGSSF